MRLCDSCFGCGRMEMKEFEEVLECDNYQLDRVELDKRIKQANNNLNSYKQVKL